MLVKIVDWKGISDDLLVKVPNVCSLYVEQSMPFLLWLLLILCLHVTFPKAEELSFWRPWSFVISSNSSGCYDRESASFRSPSPCWARFGILVHYFESNACHESCVVDIHPNDRYTCGPCPAATVETETTTKEENATMIQASNEGIVLQNGLWLTRKAFGSEISAKGSSSLVIHKGFIFVTHYSGPMSERFVGLSRKRINDDSAWTTINFPHQHVLFRQDKDLPEDQRRGDSHNVIVLGISPVDDSMHLLYDMHAYTPNDFPNDYFNYQWTQSGAAMVSDEDFTSALFSPKQLFLNPNVSDDEYYYRVTYPNFFITEKKQLFLTYRMGGATSAEIIFHMYNPADASWEAPWRWNAQSTNNRTGIYGEYRQQQGRIYFAWQRRMIRDEGEGYKNNRGLYLAYTDNLSTARGAWRSAEGMVRITPVSNLEMFQIGDPSVPGESMLGSGGGATLPYVVTPEGCFHSMVRVDGMERHCYKTSMISSLIISPNEAAWSSVSLFYLNGRVFRIGLTDDRPIIQSTEPGSDDWREEYHQAQSGYLFTHGVATLSDNSIFYYLMERMPVSSDERPLHVLRFDIK